MSVFIKSTTRYDSWTAATPHRRRIIMLFFFLCSAAFKIDQNNAWKTVSEKRFATRELFHWFNCRFVSKIGHSMEIGHFHFLMKITYRFRQIDNNSSIGTLKLNIQFNTIDDWTAGTSFTRYLCSRLILITDNDFSCSRLNT